MAVRRVNTVGLHAVAALTIGAAVAAGCGSESATPRPHLQSSAVERAESARADAEAEIADLRAELDRLEREQSPGEHRSGTSSPLPAGSAEIDGPAPTAEGRTGLFSAADRRSFARLAAGLPGREGVAVSGLGRAQRVERLGSMPGGVAWSTMKVPVAMAAVEAGSGSAGDLRQAITASDNAAAERLWRGLGADVQAAAAATAQLRAAGDARTVVPVRRLRPAFTVFGQSNWRLVDQTRFVAAMGCTAAGRQILALMADVVMEQRWGLGAVSRRASLKGGWGPGRTPGAADGWLDRQMGVAEVDGRPLAISLITDAPDHETATRSLTALARWAASHANPSAVTPGAC